jgi:hypothetical protein
MARRTIAAEVVGTAVIVAVSSTIAVAALVAVTALAIEIVAVSAFVEEDSTTAALTMSTVVRQAEYVPTKVVILGIAKQSDLLCIAIQAWSIITRQTVGCTTDPEESSLLASNWEDSAAVLAEWKGPRLLKSHRRRKGFSPVANSRGFGFDSQAAFVRVGTKAQRC